MFLEVHGTCGDGGTLLIQPREGKTARVKGIASLDYRGWYQGQPWVWVQQYSHSHYKTTGHGIKKLGIAFYENTAIANRQNIVLVRFLIPFQGKQMDTFLN